MPVAVLTVKLLDWDSSATILAVNFMRYIIDFIYKINFNKEGINFL